MTDHSWGILRAYTPEFNIKRMLETLESLEGKNLFPTKIGCGFTPGVVELKGIPVTRDPSIPTGFVFFYTDRKVLLEEDI